MTTGGGGLDPPQEGTRPPDEERARPTVEEKDDHAADERAGSGGSPGGSPDAPRDGGSGQELPNVSRGKAPSTTISTNKETPTNQEPGDPAAQSLSEEAGGGGAVNTSEAEVSSNAGIDASIDGSPKGEEGEPRAQENTSQDGDSSAGETRHNAALEAQSADPGMDDGLNLAATPRLVDYRNQLTPGSSVYRPFKEETASSDHGSQPGPSRATLRGEAEILRSDRPEGSTSAGHPSSASSGSYQDALDEKSDTSQSEKSRGGQFGGRGGQFGESRGTTQGITLGTDYGNPHGSGTHRAEYSSQPGSNRAGKRPAEEKEAEPAMMLVAWILSCSMDANGQA